MVFVTILLCATNKRLTHNLSNVGIIAGDGRMQRLVWLIFWIFVSFVTVARADEQQFSNDFEKVFAPGQTWLDSKLKIDAFVDPALDASATRQQYQSLSLKLQDLVKQKQPHNAHQKLIMLSSYLYKAGSWNDNRPFTYDMSDPFGRELTHKTLSYYLTSRKGNCVSMPILLTLLGRDVGLDMTLAHAPLHLFVKLKDDEGKIWNIEATSGGGYSRDIHYRRNLPMTDKAVEEGIYMRKLNDDESVAAMASTAVEALSQQRKLGSVIAATQMILKHDPKQIHAIVFQASAFGRYVEALQNTGLRMPSDRQLIQIYYDENQYGFQHAESLGWTEKDGLKELWPLYGGEE